jgi:hypothetical protein
MQDSRRYWTGVGIGLVCAGAVVALACGALWRASPAGGECCGRFEPEVVHASPFRILPGKRAHIHVALENSSAADVLIDELRRSHASASGEIGGKRGFPVKLASRTRRPVRITVAPSGGETGRAELWIRVIGRWGRKSRAVTAGAVAEMEFVQAVNARPEAIALGQSTADDPLREEIVQLWTPAELNIPEEISAASDDPCVSATIERLPVDASSRTGDVEVATMTIRINPAIAPSRLSARVTVKADGSEIMIPVLGFFERREPQEAVA